MVDLSILTGKAPTCYGKKAADDKQLDYMIEVYHRAIRGYEFADINSAFCDSGLRKEIVDGFGLNVDVIEKYIVLNRNRRKGRKEEKVGLGDFNPMPEDCKEALRGIGIDIQNPTDSKSIKEGI